MPTINEVVTSSNHLLHECAEHGTVSCIDKITEFIKYLEKVQDSAVKSEEYGLAIKIEHELEHWHFRKSYVTGTNDYQVSAFLTHLRPTIQ